MAEAVFKKMVRDEQLEEKIFVDSAGTSDWHVGKPPHQGTVAKLNEYGISTEGMRGRQLQKEDYDQFDYIIGMDASNIEAIRHIFQTNDDTKIMRLLDLTDDKKDVPDPYFTGDFQETYDLVTKGCRKLLEKIKREHRL